MPLSACLINYGRAKLALFNEASLYARVDIVLCLTSLLIAISFTAVRCQDSLCDAALFIVDCVGFGIPALSVLLLSNEINGFTLKSDFLATFIVFGCCIGFIVNVVYVQFSVFNVIYVLFLFSTLAFHNVVMHSMCDKVMQCLLSMVKTNRLRESSSGNLSTDSAMGVGDDHSDAAISLKTMSRPAVNVTQTPRTGSAAAGAMGSGSGLEEGGDSPLHAANGSSPDTTNRGDNATAYPPYASNEELNRLIFTTLQRNSKLLHSLKTIFETVLRVETATVFVLSVFFIFELDTHSNNLISTILNIVLVVTFNFRSFFFANRWNATISDLKQRIRIGNELNIYIWGAAVDMQSMTAIFLSLFAFLLRYLVDRDAL